MVRGDTKGNTIMVGDHVEGMGFLKNVTIDQHLLRRNRQFDLIPVIESHPELLGIGIDEDTAIVVRGDRFEVMGTGYVAIYDNTRRIDSGGTVLPARPGRPLQPEDAGGGAPAAARRAHGARGQGAVEEVSRTAELARGAR